MRFSKTKLTRVGCTIGPGIIQGVQGDLFFQMEPMKFRLTKTELAFNALGGTFRFVPASQWEPPLPETIETPIVVKPWKVAVAERQGSWSLDSVVVNVGSRFRYPNDAWTMTVTDKTYVLQHKCGSVIGPLDPDSGAFQQDKYLACTKGAPQYQYVSELEDSGLLTDGRLLLRDAKTEIIWKRNPD